MRKVSHGLSYFHICLSPHLRYVCLYGSSVPEAQFADLFQLISSLPTSLENFTIVCGKGEEELLKDTVSAFVCRCGSSPRAFRFYIPLTEAAIQRIMQLPNLCTWDTAQAPPQTAPLSVFPSLKHIYLRRPATLPWIHLLASRANISETLQTLKCPSGTIVDPTFLSSILKFRNLVILHVDTRCQVGRDCTFRLADADMESLATTLPRLKELQLGPSRGCNFCNTTVASLMSISTHCLDLKGLETHFNTLTIVGDMERLLDGNSGRDSAKCQLQKLGVGYSSPGVDGEDVETVVKGFKAIFPCLMGFTDHSGRWLELRSKLQSL